MSSTRAFLLFSFTPFLVLEHSFWAVLWGSEVHKLQLLSFSLTHMHNIAEVVAASSSKDYSCQDFLAASQQPSGVAAQGPPTPPQKNLPLPLHSACWLSSTSPAINLLPLSSQEAQAYRKIPPLLVDTDDWKWEDWRANKREGFDLLFKAGLQFPTGISILSVLNRAGPLLKTICLKNLHSCTKNNYWGTPLPQNKLWDLVICHPWLKWLSSISLSPLPLTWQHIRAVPARQPHPQTGTLSSMPVIAVGMATKSFPDWEQVAKLVYDS